LPPTFLAHPHPVSIQRIHRQRVSRNAQPPLDLILDHANAPRECRLRLEHRAALPPPPRPWTWLCRCHLAPHVTRPRRSLLGGLVRARLCPRNPILGEGDGSPSMIVIGGETPSE